MLFKGKLWQTRKDLAFSFMFLNSVSPRCRAEAREQALDGGVGGWSTPKEGIDHLCAAYVHPSFRTRVPHGNQQYASPGAFLQGCR